MRRISAPVSAVLIAFLTTLPACNSQERFTMRWPWAKEEKPAKQPTETAKAQPASQTPKQNVAARSEPAPAAQTAPKEQEVQQRVEQFTQQVDSPPAAQPAPTTPPTEARSAAASEPEEISLSDPAAETPTKPAAPEPPPAASPPTEKLADASAKPKRPAPTRVEPPAKKEATAPVKREESDSPPAAPKLPPRIKSISIRPASAPPPAPVESAPPVASPTPRIETAKPTERVATNEPAVESDRDGLAARIAELEQAVSRTPNDVDAQVRLRMLYLADGRSNQAIAPTPGMDTELAAVLRGIIEPLAAAQNSAAPVTEAAWANRQIEVLDQARRKLAARADLRVPLVKLCNEIRGYGNYREIEPLEFVAGVTRQVLVYVEVENYKTERTADGKFRSLMLMRSSILDAGGRELLAVEDDDIADESATPRNGFFMRKFWTIPAQLRPGEYTAKIEVEDKIGRKTNGNSLKFRVVQAKSIAATPQAAE